MVKFGYNIDSSSISFERAVDAIRNSGADTHLIMVSNRTYFYRQGEIDTIVRYCQTFPEMSFIVRLFHDSQGDWKAYPKASEYQTNWTWARQKLGAYASRVIFDNPVNEPNLPDNSNANHPDVAAYVERCVDWIKAASVAGIKLAVGAFAVGTLQESVLNTTYKSLWQAMKNHNQALSYHGYGAIPFEAGETAPLDIVLDATKARAYMKDERWPMSHAGWLIAETYRVIQICEAMGFTPEIYLTECIVDNVLGQNPVIKEAWRSKYGIEMFMRDPRGIRTWERYLKEFMPESSFDEAIAALLKHARKNIYYHRAFKAACLFALNRQWDYGYDGFLDGTNKHAGSNYDRPEFTRFRQTLLAQVNKDEIMPILYDATISSKSISNIRVLPSDTALFHSASPLTTTPIEVKIAKEPAVVNGQTIIDGFQWLDLSINGERGYIAKTQNVIIEYVPIVPAEPLYEVALGYATIRMTAQQVDWTATIFEGMAFAIRNAPKVE